MVLIRSIAWRGLMVLAIIAAGSVPTRAGFTIRDLGPMPAAGTTSGALAINAGGQAAGFLNPPASGMRAASSSATGGLSPVAVPSGGSASMANSINSGGSIAGDYTGSNGQHLGFYGNATGSTSIPVLTGPNNTSGNATYANAINDSGQVAGYGTLPSGVDRAFVITGGVTKLIGPLGGGDPSTSNLANVANGINGSGVVVGTSELFSGGTQHAFYTGPNGVPMDLITPSTQGDFFANSYGKAIANDGDIVGQGDVGNSEHAFYAHSGAALVDLGTLVNNSSSSALGVNNLGMVVGTSGGRAFLWDQVNGLVDLNSKLSPADQSNWVLTQATGINDNGQISGEGLLNGVMEGFVLTATPSTVPEPPALALSTAGLAIAWGWSRRRVRGLAVA